MAQKTTKKQTIGAEIKAALDGRTQRWLAVKISMAEDKLSNKLNGIDEFTDLELYTISNVLGVIFLKGENKNSKE